MSKKLISEKSKALHAFLCERYAELGYLPVLQKLAAEWELDLWVTGGWIRGALLGHPGYAGDVDCLTSKTLRDIESLAKRRQLSWHTSFSGTVRIMLPDGNHIDVKPIRTANGHAAVGVALKSFNTSVNAIAVRIRDGKAIASDHSLSDLKAGRFRILGQDVTGYEQRNYWRDIEGLMRYYGLRPNGDALTATVVQQMEDVRAKVSATNTESAFAAAKHLVCPLIPANCRAWIVRGYVRAAILGELCFWDDIDVVVQCRQERLVAHLLATNHKFVLNFYGSPKVRLSSGQTVDVWGLEHSLVRELARYEFNVDSLAWDLSNNTLLDPLGVSENILKRRLIASGLSRMSCAGANPYGALKAAYLCLRHNLEPVGLALELLGMPFVASGFLRQHAHRLARELWCSHTSDMSLRVARLRRMVTASSALDYLCAGAPAGESSRL